MSSPSEAASPPDAETTPSRGAYDLYPLLAAQFAEVFERPGAAADGGSLVYLTGEQVVSRLNRTLGLEG